MQCNGKSLLEPSDLSVKRLRLNKKEKERRYLPLKMRLIA